MCPFLLSVCLPTGGKSTAFSLPRPRGAGFGYFGRTSPKKTTVIAQVVASERAGAQTGPVTAGPGLKDRRRRDETRLAKPAGKPGHSG